MTLVDLLVSLAVIAVLLALLLPGVRSARIQARSVACGALQHALVAGLHLYAAEFDDWLPGHNTTGFELWVQRFGDGGRGMSQSRLPVQTYDWMTPILRLSTTLPANRAKRFRYLLEAYRCPAVRFSALLYVDLAAGEVLPPDHHLFEAEVAAGGAFPAISYLMPVHFQQWGQQTRPGEVIGWHPDLPIPYPVKRNPAGAGEWEVRITNYESRMHRVGPPAEKIAFADGTRYLPTTRVLDFDHHDSPAWFGSFTSSGGWWVGSTAYGERYSPSRGGNVPLSFRHHDGLRAAFFDGHVERLARRQARRIDYWYPRGGEVVAHPLEGFTDFATYPSGYVIR